VITVRPVLLVLALLVPVLALGACGSSEEDEVRAAYERFAATIDKREGKAACEMLTPATRRRTAEAAGYRFCQQVIEDLSKARRARFVATDPDLIEIDGDRATLLFEDGRAAPVELERIDGTWMVATGPPLGR